MARVTIRKLTRSGDEALAVKPEDLATALPSLLRKSAAAIKTDQSEARFVGSDPGGINADKRYF